MKNRSEVITNEKKVPTEVKRPSEVINTALAENLAVGLYSAEDQSVTTLWVALYRAAGGKVGVDVIKKLIMDFGGNPDEFGYSGSGIYDVEAWTKDLDLSSLRMEEIYAGYQVNKAFFLMMMEEWFLRNPEEDSWEAVAKWKMENGGETKISGK